MLENFSLEEVSSRHAVILQNNNYHNVIARNVNDSYSNLMYTMCFVQK